MRTLALDVGLRRTGIAYRDDAVGIALPLDTFAHTSRDALLAHVRRIIEERKIDCVIVGLPRLPSGDEGQQAGESRAVGEALKTPKIEVLYVDERHTTPRSSNHKNALPTANLDGDAAAACALFH